MSQRSERRQQRRGWGLLFSGFCFIAFVWMFALPRLATLSPVRSHIELMELESVDPSAMFYTELDQRFWFPDGARRSTSGISSVQSPDEAVR